MTSILELQDISRAFRLPSGEELAVLTSVNLTVSEGQSVAIKGRSGSGKSTLMNILGLLEQSSSGTMLLSGVNVSSLGDRKRAELRGSTLGFVFQQFHLMDRRTALENIAEPLLFGTHDERRTRVRRAEYLLDVVGLSERASAMPNVLSGGEQQRVAIARALARKPRIVLADEPTGALDGRTGERVLDLLIGLTRSEGMTLVIVTHDDAIARKANRTLHLVDGVLVGDPL